MLPQISRWPAARICAAVVGSAGCRPRTFPTDFWKSSLWILWKCRGRSEDSRCLFLTHMSKTGAFYSHLMLNTKPKRTPKCVVMAKAAVLSGCFPVALPVLVCGVEAGVCLVRCREERWEHVRSNCKDYDLCDQGLIVHSKWWDFWPCYNKVAFCSDLIWSGFLTKILNSCSHADFSFCYIFNLLFLSLLCCIHSDQITICTKFSCKISGLPWVLGTYHPHFDLSKLASCTISCQTWVSWDLSLNVCVIIPSHCNEILAA